MRPTWQPWNRLTVPTMFLLGSDSPSFFKQTTETLSAHLPNSQIVVLPGQQHSAMLTAPELFANEIIHFLKSVNIEFGDDPQTEDVLKTLAPISGNAIFLILSGNWDGTEFIDRLLPRERYLMGYADAGGTIRGDGVYWTNLGAEIHLGEVDGKPSEKLEKVKALFAHADMKPDVQENIVHWIGSTSRARLDLRLDLQSIAK